MARADNLVTFYSQTLNICTKIMVDNKSFCWTFLIHGPKKEKFFRLVMLCLAPIGWCILKHCGSHRGTMGSDTIKHPPLGSVMWKQIDTSGVISVYVEHVLCGSTLSTCRCIRHYVGGDLDDPKHNHIPHVIKSASCCHICLDSAAAPPVGWWTDYPSSVSQWMDSEQHSL